MSEIEIKPDYINEKIILNGIELTPDEASSLALRLAFWSVNIKKRVNTAGITAV